MLPVDTVNAPYDAILRIARVDGGHDEARFQQLERRFIAPEQRSVTRRQEAEARQTNTFGNSTVQAPPFGHDTLAAALNAYVLGTATNLVFGELRPEGIVVVTAQLDALGVPTRNTEAELLLRWRDLIPPDGSSVDADEYLFQLAGGRGDLTQSATSLVDELVRQVQPVLFIGDHAADLRIVLINRIPGWPAATLVGAAIQLRCPWLHDQAIAPDDGRSFDAIVDDILAGAPLRYDYDLVIASIHPNTRKVEAGTIQLFASGATRTTPTQNVSILSHRTARTDLEMFVVARQPGIVLSQRPVVYSGTLPLSGGDACALTVKLERPGVLNFTSLRTPTQAPLSLPESLKKLPEYDQTGSQTAALDLVVMLDLIGSDDLVSQRKTFVKETLTALAAAYEGLGLVRVALIGVRDELHVEYERRLIANAPPLTVIERVDFTDPARIMRVIDAARPFNHGAQDYPSALDEALEGLSGLTWRQAESRRCVVIVTSRPPHPEKQGAHQLTPSRTNEDWRRVFQEVRDARALRAILVECPTSWRVEMEDGPVERPLLTAVAEYTEECWQTLSPDGHFLLVDTTPEQLAAAIDEGGADPSQAIRLPLRAFARG